MKKVMMCLVIVGLFFSASLSNLGISSYALSLDRCDEAFVIGINDFMEDKGYDSQSIQAHKDIVYDINLNELGVLYTFEVNNAESYAIVIEQNNDYLLSECYFETKSPYKNSQGIFVYVTSLTYMEYEDNQYYSLGRNHVLSAEEIASLQDIAFCGSAVFTSATETINYTYRSQSAYKMAFRFPQYSEVDTLSNACAAIAGGNILGYYDRYHEALIPNFVSGALAGANYIYKGQNADINSAITKLYADMGTNSLGTTYTQFVDGMTRYCNNVGRSMSVTSCMTNNKLNYSYAKSQISNNIPVALFLLQYNITLISKLTNQDVNNYLNSDGNHVMVGFGYLDVTYTYSNSTTKTYNYIEVATGLTARKIGYFNINYNTTIYNACAINIY